MSTRTTPEDGDLIVRPEQREGNPVYVLRTAPGSDPVSFPSRREAILQAVMQAGRQHVRAWWTDEAGDFVLLRNFRIAETRKNRRAS